ncbi:MAG: ABC-2 family transporter protein [Candidatus Omnitrophica bacterium ADurb.Bin277]|nr:MAG: ABC-2 family transporter protein [Candidatus Omnitrophica bacterium ADurb.Bin277]
MKKVFAIARKEFASFFRSWTGVLTGVMFFLITGIFFVMLVLSYAKISMDPRGAGFSSFPDLSQTHYIFGSFFLNVNVILLFLVPLLTMRSFAEEKKHETLELLFTYPLSDLEIVAGKLLGLIWFFEILLVPLAGYFLVFHLLGGEVDWGPVLSGFLGFWVLGVAYLAAGVFISTLTKSSVMSAMGTFGLLVIFWMMDLAPMAGGGGWPLLISAMSPLKHFRNLTYGILDLRDLVYFGFFFFYFLFLSLRSIETRNWKNV